MQLILAGFNGTYVLTMGSGIFYPPHGPHFMYDWGFRPCTTLPSHQWAGNNNTYVCEHKYERRAVHNLNRCIDGVRLGKQYITNKIRIQVEHNVAAVRLNHRIARGWV